MAVNFEMKVMEELFGKKTPLALPLFKILRKRTKCREDFEDSIIEFYLKARRILDKRPEARTFPARYWVRVCLSITDQKNPWLRPLGVVGPANDLFCNPNYIEAWAWKEYLGKENYSG